MIQKINENINNLLIQNIKNIELNITPNIELSIKPIKKLNKKIIKSEILVQSMPPITNNIIESNNIIEFENTESNNNIIELENTEPNYNIIQIETIDSESVFNFDNDIIVWFKLNYELTNNKEDTIKLKDIYDVFSNSIHFTSMKKIQRMKYNKSYFVNFIEKCSFFKPYYCQVSRLLRTFIKCWKIKTEININ